MKTDYREALKNMQKYEVLYNHKKNRYDLICKKSKYSVSYCKDLEHFILCDSGNNKYHHSIYEFIHETTSIKHYPEYIKNQVFYLFTYMNC